MGMEYEEDESKMIDFLNRADRGLWIITISVIAILSLVTIILWILS